MCVRAAIRWRPLWLSSHHGHRECGGERHVALGERRQRIRRRIVGRQRERSHDRQCRFSSRALTGPAATLTSSSATFQWTVGSGVRQYVLWIGTTGAGSSDLYVMTPGTNTSVTVNSLPVNGHTLYVRLWSLVSAGWQDNDYTFIAYNASAGSLAVLTNPANHATLTSSSSTFQWSVGSDA